MLKKIASIGVVVLFSLALCTPTAFADAGADSPLPKLSTPKIVLTKQVICKVGTRPKIELKSDEPGVTIYYTIKKGPNFEGKEKRYTKPISIVPNGWPNTAEYQFTLCALARKEGFEDSDVLTQKFNYLHGCMPPPPFDGYIKWCKPRIGDSYIKGTFNKGETSTQEKLFKKLKIRVGVAVIGKNGKITRYSATVKNGVWKVKLKHPLRKGEKVFTYADTIKKIVKYKKTKSLIRITETYCTFSGKSTKL